MGLKNSHDQSDGWRFRTLLEPGEISFCIVSARSDTDGNAGNAQILNVNTLTSQKKPWLTPAYKQITRDKSVELKVEALCLIGVIRA